MVRVGLARTSINTVYHIWMHGNVLSLTACVSGVLSAYCKNWKTENEARFLFAFLFYADRIYTCEKA